MHQKTIAVPTVPRRRAARVFDVWVRKHKVYWFGGGYASIRERRVQDATGGHLYFAAPIDGIGPIKIGYSRKPEQRSTSFRSAAGSPYVGVVFIDNFNQASERLLHTILADYAVAGEFYDESGPVAELMLAIQSLGSGRKLTTQRVRSKTQHRCAICKEQGHNRATCANQLQEAC